MIQLALYNLTRERQARRARGETVAEHLYFRWREDICVWIDKHWDTLTPGKARTLTWSNTIASYLSIKHDRCAAHTRARTLSALPPPPPSWADPHAPPPPARVRFAPASPRASTSSTVAAGGR